MKDYIKSIIDKKAGYDENLNRLREYIQTYFLYISYRKKYYQNMVFTGGTALRFIYGIRRFSEDLNFSLSMSNRGFDFLDMLKDVEQEFKLAGYSIEVKPRIKGQVYSAQLKFPQLLFETGLSMVEDEKLMIKVEIDSNPPEGGLESHTLYNKTFMFHMVHYDLASLFAGKLHALLRRKYTKGRDWYDLIWYLSKFKNIEPNYLMLNNALAQTSKVYSRISKENWKSEILKIACELEWRKVRNDVGRFLEDHNEVSLLAIETFKSMLG
ncbi:MAG: nucleotidyl transferase AbiEii/AbiGii toxin family protein [Candidatus Omnitrophota bacterium]